MVPFLGKSDCPSLAIHTWRAEKRLDTTLEWSGALERRFDGSEQGPVVLVYEVGFYTTLAGRSPTRVGHACITLSKKLDSF